MINQSEIDKIMDRWVQDKAGYFTTKESLIRAGLTEQQARELLERDIFSAVYK